MGSCLRGGDGRGVGGVGAWVPACAGMTEGGRRTAGGGGSGPLTPHLASPLKGGRDELGKEWGVWGWVRGFLPAQE